MVVLGAVHRHNQYARSYGLDFFPVIFEMVDFNEMNEVASYGGFPVRYPHWRFGMQYQYMEKSYSYGLHKIYEMVINNNPCYAYLLDNNKMVDQKMVGTYSDLYRCPHRCYGIDRIWCAGFRAVRWQRG